MRIKVEWSSEFTRAIIAEFSRDWTWEDMSAALDEVIRLVEGVDDAKLVLALPSNTLYWHKDIIANLNKTISRVPRNIQFIVLVGASTMTVSMLNVLRSAGIGKNFRFVRTIEEAYPLLSQD